MAGYIAEVYWRDSFDMIRREVFIDTDFGAVARAAEEWIKMFPNKPIIESQIKPYVDYSSNVPMKTTGVIPYLNEGSTDAEILRLRY